MRPPAACTCVTPPMACGLLGWGVNTLPPPPAFPPHSRPRPLAAYCPPHSRLQSEEVVAEPAPAVEEAAAAPAVEEAAAPAVEEAATPAAATASAPAAAAAGVPAHWSPTRIPSLFHSFSASSICAAPSQCRPCSIPLNGVCEGGGVGEKKNSFFLGGCESFVHLCTPRPIPPTPTLLWPAVPTSCHRWRGG